MTRRSIFDHAVNSTLFNPSFVAATNVINHNYAHPGRSDRYQSQSRLLCERPSGQLGPRLKTIDVGDIILTREVSSRVIDVMTKPNEKGRVLKSTNPFRARIIRQRQARFTKVRRIVHVAEILEFGDRSFTVVQFEAEDPSDRAQLELALSGAWEDWLFNLRTGTFQFDLTSNRQLSYTESHVPIRSENVALPGNASMGGPLIPQSIIQHLQNHLSDYLNSVSSMGEMRYIGNLSELIMTHPYLAIGSVIDVTKRGIIGYFPPSDVFVNPGPVWTCERDPDHGFHLDSYQFYESGRHRVDLSYSEETEPFQIHLLFKNKPTLSNAARLSYLSQSSRLLETGSNWEDLVLIEEISFALYGHYKSNPLNYPTPIYLFVPPVPFDQENGIPGLALPLPYRLFYWSLDPEGRTPLPEKDWEKYGVPRLRTELWLGPFWYSWCYEAVNEFFRLGNHDPQTYARERGYPALQKWQDNRFSVVGEDAVPTRYPIWKGMGSSYEEPLIWKLHQPQYSRKRRWSNAMI
ncbi:hypothetical protein PQX77_021636 [Marasmius sp. AFHP31]|nr:hypothetical protein PQX77_021636 [Marasmius sp. AFHP31]